MADLTTAPPAHLNDVVVSQAHKDIVLEELSRLVDLDILADEPQLGRTNEALGLALIPLKFRPDPIAIEAVGPAGAGSVGVDDVLRMVRESCSYRFRGWLPVVGKNRVLSGISGEGGFLSGGGGFLSGGGGFLSGGGGFLSGGGGGLPSLAEYPPRKPRGSLGGNARIAVLDTPIFRDTPLGKHIEYVGKQPTKKEPMPVEAGHAAFVVGLVEQAAPGAVVQARPTLNRHALADAWTVACAMADYADSDVDIVNISLGCYTLDSQPPLLLQRAVDVLSPTTLIVAAAGNHRQPRHPRPFWPGAMDDVLAVGAVDGRGHLASFSPRAPWVDVTAPGVDIVSTYLDGKVELKAATDRKPAEIEAFPGYARWRGTSFAAATVTGEIAAHMTPKRSARKALEHLLDLPEDKSPVRAYKFK